MVNRFENRSKLRAALVQLERIRLALKQQKLKDRTFQIQARNETKMILEIVKSIRQNEQERLILLDEKLDKAEAFHQYRNNLKKKLDKMRSERDQNLKKEEEKLKREEEKRLKVEKEKRERFFLNSTSGPTSLTSGLVPPDFRPTSA